MKDDIQDLVCEKDVKCPKCGSNMEIVSKINGKSIFQCVNCGYKV